MMPRGRTTGPARAVALAGVVALALCSACGRSGPKGGVSMATVPVESKGVGVSVRDLAAKPEGERLEWAFTLVCDEPEGCRGTLRVEVRYRSRGEARMFSMTREVDLLHAGEVRVGRSGPAEKVDGVDRVRVALVARPPEGPTPPGGQPRPTPRV